MKYTQDSCSHTLEIKQSKFISYFFPFTLYKQTLKSLKEQHPKARHFVTAYRYINDFKQIVEHSSDDGEPKGTSGRPTLMVLQGAGIINAAVITVRYFGGTKLGTGGLVRAYSDVTNLVLDEAILIEYKEQVTKNIIFEYTNQRKIDYECKLYNISIIEKSFSDTTHYKIKSDINNMNIFLNAIDRLAKVTN